MRPNNEDANNLKDISPRGKSLFRSSPFCSVFAARERQERFALDIQTLRDLFGEVLESMANSTLQRHIFREKDWQMMMYRRAGYPFGKSHRKRKRFFNYIKRTGKYKWLYPKISFNWTDEFKREDFKRFLPQSRFLPPSLRLIENTPENRAKIDRALGLPEVKNYE